MDSKTVYQTDSNGFYLYPTVAYELPLAPGTYNIPYGAYEEEPPPAPAGMVARWNGAGWDVVEDNRQAVLYLVATGAQYSIGSVVQVGGIDVRYDGGGPVPDWLTEEEPAPALP